MSGKAIIIIVAGIIIIAGLILYRIEASSTNIVANVNKYYFRQSNQNIAQTGVNMALRKVADNSAWRTGFPLMDLLGGKVTVSLMDSTFYGRKVVKITSVGIYNYGKSSERRDTSIALLPRKFIPGSFKGLVTTGGPTKTNGSITIDARDHNPTAPYSVLPAQGTYAVFSTSSFTPGGGSSGGGTASGVDYAPTNPWNAAIWRQNQPWPGPDPFPGTPDSVFGGASNGFPEGTLKSVAQKGIGGSQYVTNPAALTYPLKGVTYVELPAGGMISGINISGSGILVVHNNTKDAVVKNCGNNFIGIIIIDDMDKFGDFLVGALITLTRSASSGNTLGNSNGSMLYSHMAIENAIDFVFSSVNGSAANVIAWWE